jgi:SAM-dependent methyltransferase
MLGLEAAYRRLFAAIYDPVVWPAERLLFGPHRESLVSDLSGAVLDLGCGTGAMFPSLAEAPNITVYAVEPDPYMRRRAERRAASVGLDVEIAAARAEQLPFADDSLDVVLAGMVLCTVADPAAALAEAARVLRPGGELRFFEHVRGEGVRGRLQDRATPLWRRVAGGCHANRETGAHIEAHPRFRVTDLTRLDLGVFPVRPFVRGTAVRAAASV